MSTGGFDTALLYHPYIMMFVTQANSEAKSINSLNILIVCSLPWDQSTPLGYFTEVCFVAHNGLTYFVGSGGLLLFLISICFHHHAFYQIFKQSVDELNYFDGNRNDKELLCDLIRFHTLVKE